MIEYKWLNINDWKWVTGNEKMIDNEISINKWDRKRIFKV